MQKMTEQGAGSHPFDEASYALSLIERIVAQCPRRKATSDDERRAHLMLMEEFRQLGFHGHLESFEFNDSLYANMALHFGLGSLGSLISGLAPAAGLALHLLAGSSYVLDTWRRKYLLRRLLPFRPSQNLVLTLPARAEPALRIVLLAHVDAAFTGLLFRPELLRRLARHWPPPFEILGRPAALAAYSQFALAACDLARIFLGPLTLPLRPLEALLTLPGLFAFLLNFEVVLRNEIVPGANDDLGGVAALALLARRLAPGQRDDIELVFVATGAEEASMGGASALVERHAEHWRREQTVILGLDCLSGGELRFFDEGEIVHLPSPDWLLALMAQVASSESRFENVRSYRLPAGGSDVAPFLSRGYDAICLGCIDPRLGVPRHYHLPSDTPENLDGDSIVQAVDFVEQLIFAIIAHRLGANI